MNKDKVAVLTDSGCDVPQNFREKYNIFMLPLRVMYPEKDYEDGVNIDPMMVIAAFLTNIPALRRRRWRRCRIYLTRSAKRAMRRS